MKPSFPVLATLALLLATSCAGPHPDPAGQKGSGGVPKQSENGDELSRVFRSLHEPVARIYEIGLDRDALHARLTASFVGEQLTREYVEHFTTLARMRQDGIGLRILRVDYESIEVIPQGAGRARVEADWSVGGVVRHRQHRHVRTNRYRAGYELVDTADGWRIASTYLRDMSRVGRFSALGQSLPNSRGGLLSPLEMLKAGMGEELPAAREESATDGETPPP